MLIQIYSEGTKRLIAGLRLDGNLTERVYIFVSSAGKL